MHASLNVFHQIFMRALMCFRYLRTEALYSFHCQLFLLYPACPFSDAAIGLQAALFYKLVKHMLWCSER